MQRASLAWAGALASVVLAAGGALYAGGNPAGGFWPQLAGRLGISSTTLLADIRTVKLAQFQHYATAHHLSAQIAAR